VVAAILLLSILQAPAVKQAPPANNPGAVFRVGGGVSAPEPLYAVVPEYTREALAAKYQGSVTLSVVVDPSGSARDIRVVRALGLGLDQKAFDAASRWLFFPGKKDGQPIAVVTQIQLTFRLSDQDQTAGAEGPGICGARADVTSLDPVMLMAEQANANAQYAIGCLSLRGQGVEQDAVQAHLWFSLAAAQGFAAAAKARDTVARTMTPEQIAKAQALLREWKPRTP
jgi:TonB family protein